MPRYNDLDDSAKALVDNIVHYSLIAEKCAVHLRQYDEALLSRLWEEQQAIFLGDPITYPTTMVESDDTEGKLRFWEKCETLFFPVGSERLLQDYIMMYFAATAGLQLAYAEAVNYPHCSYLCHIASRRSLQIRGDQPDQDSGDELDYTVNESPVDLIDQKIRCRDKSSGEIIEYVVVDYLESWIGGYFFALEDQHGRTYNVTPEQLKEIRVD